MALMTLEQLLGIPSGGVESSDSNTYADLSGVDPAQQQLAQMLSGTSPFYISPENLSKIGIQYGGAPVQTDAGLTQAVTGANQALAGQAPGTLDPTGVFSVPQPGMTPAQRNFLLAGTGIVGGAALGLGGAGVEAAGGAALPESYWSATAGLAPTSDAAVAGAGTIGAETAAPFVGSTGGGVTEAGYNFLNTPSVGGGFTGTALPGYAAAGATPLARLTGMSQPTSDLLSVLGTVGATGLGAYSANRQSDQLAGLAAQSRADRAPFLGAATNYLNNPQAFIEGPGAAAMKGTLAGLSAKFGNPIGSGAALQYATDAGLKNWLDATTGLANIGLSGEDTRARLGSAAIGKEGDIYTTLAGGAADLLNPRRTLADQLRELKSAGLI